jgi:hypothetical protein
VAACQLDRVAVSASDAGAEPPDKIETVSWVQLGDAEEARYEAAVSERNLMAMRQAPVGAKLERLREIVEEASEDGMKVGDLLLLPRHA